MTTIRPRDIAALDVPLADVEAEVAAISARAHAAVPNPDGQHLDQWHAFFDIDPDLLGRDYSQPTDARPGGAA
ncbi:hypothetical protein ABZ953_06475 [Streptomyces sp. NPDC046465]|uniref:hypothetical protein n=1 Tax=Streptomyces sp. NPDC046465 TaxID=3155810 RepID=UPI0033F0CF1D